MERKCIYFGDHTVLTELTHGPKIFLDTRDMSVAQYIIWYGFYWEKWVTDVFMALLKPGMVVLDIGANCGYYSLLAAQAVGPSGEVHCIEPLPSLHKNLKRSFLINGYHHVKLHKVAVSDKDEEMTLYVPGDFTGGATIRDISSITDYGEVKAVKVPSVNFAAYFPNLKAHVIKIDIHGPEPLLADGLLKIAENSGNLDILMEFAPTLWGNAKPEEFFARFINNHFSIVVLEHDGKLTTVTLDQISAISKKLVESRDFIDLWLSRRVI